MKKQQKELKELEHEYINLAKKLGKFPTFREVKRFICSDDKLLRIVGENGMDSFNKFKAHIAHEHPLLNDLLMPVKVTAKEVEDYRLGLISKSNKNHNKKVVEETSFYDYLEQLSEKCFRGKVKPIKVNTKNKKTKRILNLILSDLHIGSDIKKDETGIANYGKIEESRRLAAIVKEVVDYKPQYRAETELEVGLIGDIIQNSLHDPRDGAPLAEQACRAIHLLTQALQQLAANFKKVRVRCSPGNHGRNTARHHGRAVNQKWDAIETIIYYALQKALSNQTNIEFFIPKTPWGVYEVFGQKILYTHGDSVIKPGYPSASINIKSLEGQINKINAAMSDMDEYKVVLVGHVHTASQTYLGNGTVMITNGALVDPDEFAVSIGIMEAQTGQMLFESVPGYAVGDTRFIRVGRKHDKDESLDLIIKPYETL